MLVAKKYIKNSIIAVRFVNIARFLFKLHSLIINNVWRKSTKLYIFAKYFGADYIGAYTFIYVD